LTHHKTDSLSPVDNQPRQGRVEKIVNGGWGLVRGDLGVVFLNYVLPGEDVVYRIRERAKGVLWGQLLEVVNPSKHRVLPPCPYFGECGGCVFQHIDYPFQETIKREILQNDLERIGHYTAPLPPLFLGPAYNNRVRARMKGVDDGRIGFIRKGTNTVLPIDHCLLFPDAVNRFLAQWNNIKEPPFIFQMDIFFNPDNQKVYIYLSHPPDERVWKVLQSFPDIIFSWKGNEAVGISPIRIKGHIYYVSPDVFFQVNPHQWENMLDTVSGYLEESQVMIDLYCGVGFFIPVLMQRAQQVIGVESYGFSVALAQRAFPGARFYKLPAEKFHFPPAASIVIDPPRSGLAKVVLNRILFAKYERIIYISCASAAFSRDLKLLVENGYQLADLQVFDLFPQTSHLETMALFTRGK